MVHNVETLEWSCLFQSSKSSFSDFRSFRWETSLQAKDSIHELMATNKRNGLRYIRYNKEVTKTLSLKFNLATLPPTSETASQHSLRVYLQVQQWLRNNLDPTEWGWFMKDGRLNPVPSTLPATSEELLQLILQNNFDKGLRRKMPAQKGRPLLYKVLYLLLRKDMQKFSYSYSRFRR
ncbi:hypothetical protein AVEN_55288-1 [Araneus ventricosus]|uniref:Uncharacterized protein n=1 Tax=Araneus ventricosus TaxID=182803 RepID=A0A4Y2D6V1_ARAVE|nr:hypothetical protein AVEN_55288-1 [Araneus ventricosus]